MDDGSFLEGVLRTVSGRCEIKNPRLAQAIMGVTTEAVELLDALKKECCQGRDMVRSNIIEELGDLEFYMAIIRKEVDVDRAEVLRRNAEKLASRYPNGFETKRSENRNLEKELDILER